MVFSSTLFLFLFLPVTLLVYYLLKDKYKNIWLLIASLVFYSWGEAKFVYFMMASIVFNYFFAIGIAKYDGQKLKKKILLILSLSVDLGLLLYFKYFDFLLNSVNSVLSFVQSKSVLDVRQIALPVGISFYTFQIISYVVDVYRNEVKPQRNILNLAMYKTLFPQLVAGPIVRYADIEDQITHRTYPIDKVADGCFRFMIGFSKKVLIANNVATLADLAFSKGSSLTCAFAWVGAAAYALQIYFDFSGYSDMAIGLGKMLGFDFLENFDYPYISRNIKEFWRRWHISLSSWFRDYLYIPLGGNRKGQRRTYINLAIVFFMTGLWHGASMNFIVWGLYHGAFLILERVKVTGKFINKLPPFLGRIYALLVVLIGWVFFRADNLSAALVYLKKMFTFSHLGVGYAFSNFNVEITVFFAAGLLFSAPIFKRLLLRIEKIKADGGVRLASSLTIGVDVAIAVVFFISVLYVSGSNFNPFIYFRF